MKKYIVLFGFFVIILIEASLLTTPVEAAITYPYIIDQKPQVIFGDSTEIITASTTHHGLEGYTHNYINGYAHFTFTYTHHGCCYAGYPPIVYITRIDPRTTLRPIIKSDLPAYLLPPFNQFPTDWYLYDIQFDATGYTISVRQQGTSTEIYKNKTEVLDMTPSDWVSIANLYPLSETGEGNIHSMAFTPVHIREDAYLTVNPVIIIPGIMGSAKKNGELVIDPILHTYDDLIETLDVNGYTKEVDLFTFPYEWRDSNVFSANLLDNKIEEVKQICNCDRVDLVAHSMGGLVARAYIQSTDYDQDVDQLIFLGTPHSGSPQAYLQWEAGEFPPDVGSSLKGLFFEAEALKNGYLTIFDYIHNRPILSVKELLPIYDYLKDKDTGIIRTYPNNYPTNPFLESLNANISKLFNSGVRITNVVGDSGADNTIETIRVVPTYHSKFWQHGEPENFEVLIGDNGLEGGIGDNTVSTFGATLGGPITNESSGASHSRIPTEEENKIYKLLTNKDSVTNIDSGFNLSTKVLILQLFSPIDVVVTAPDGKKIGKNFVNGQEYSEIPGAFYSGYNNSDNEYITILNPLDGEYKIELQGTGDGSYKVESSLIEDSRVTTKEFVGTTTTNQITNFNIELDQESQTPIIIDTPDTLPPAILITNPQPKDYLRSEKISILASSTDSSGVKEFALSINNTLLNSGDNYDPFFGKLGTTTLFATSTDNENNIATSSTKFRIIANATSTASDIERAYVLGWVKDKKEKDALIANIKKLVKLEIKVLNLRDKLPNGQFTVRKVETSIKVVDKALEKSIRAKLDTLLRNKIINKQAFDLIVEDINWIVSN